MIFNEKFLFLHYPKSGGMMLTAQFINKLKKNLYYTLPNGHIEPSLAVTCKLRGIEVLKGIRHENYSQAKNFFVENNLPHRIENFERIMVVIRNPYDYIVSRFHYLKDNRQYNNGPAARIASEGDFRKYAMEAPRFFQVDGYILDENGKIPDNLYIVRFEDFATQINKLLKDDLTEPIDFGVRINTSKRKKYTDYITDNEVEEAIYKKFRLLFDKGFYSRRIF